MPSFTLKKTAAPVKPQTDSAPIGHLLFFFANFFNLFVVLMCLLILAAGYLFLIKPKYDFVASNQRVIEEEKMYQQKIDYLKQLNEIKALYATVSAEDKSKIDTVLSAGQDIDSLKIALLREIGYIGRINGASVENLEPKVLDNTDGKFISLKKGRDTMPANAPLDIILITFTLEKTDYEQLQRILVRLERSIRLLDVTAVDFDPALRRAKIELYAYHYKK